MHDPLPKDIREFFDNTSDGSNDPRRPPWLHSNECEAIWKVDDGSDIRSINGEVVGGGTLKWMIPLTHGDLTEANYDLLRSQAQQLLVFAFNRRIIPKLSTSHLALYHMYMKWMIEYLDQIHPDSLRDVGLACASLDDLESFLEANSKLGVCGTGQLIERWEKYLASSAPEANTREKKIAFLISQAAYSEVGKVRPKFIELKTGISRSRRLSKAFSSHMRQYDLDNVAEQNDDRKESTPSSNALVVWLRNISKVMSEAPPFTSFQIADSVAVRMLSRNFISRRKRTRTIPTWAGANLIAALCTWVTNYSDAALAYIRLACVLASSMDEGNGKDYRHVLRAAESKLTLPNVLSPLLSHVLHFRRVGYERRDSVSQNASIVLTLTRIQIGVTFALTVLFACCRRSEAIRIEGRDIVNRDDRHYLRVVVGKSGVGAGRRSMLKPIPRIVAECLKTLDKWKECLSQFIPNADSACAHKAFFKTGFHGLMAITKNDIAPALNQMTDALDLRVSGSRMRIRSHELRRFFAMTFFHFSGCENSLPALSWFMGHTDVSMTWRYIKEELTGSEITQAEVAMATSVVFSRDESDDINSLRQLLLDHFGCADISVMDERDVEDYLEMMAERGRFSATPVQIVTEGRVRFTVLINVRGE